MGHHSPLFLAVAVAVGNCCRLIMLMVVNTCSGGGAGSQAGGGSAGGGPVGYAPVSNTRDNPPCNTLFVGNLGDAVQEADLQALFGGQPVRTGAGSSPDLIDLLPHAGWAVVHCIICSINLDVICHATAGWWLPCCIMGPRRQHARPVLAIKIATCTKLPCP